MPSSKTNLQNIIKRISPLGGGGGLHRSGLISETRFDSDPASPLPTSVALGAFFPFFFASFPAFLFYSTNIYWAPAVCQAFCLVLKF